ncbi:RIP metalloprotease RseP [Neptunitalea lumnitzerae]|uniref:Zinc metalloprotease n=1 Tax=Neptunitalea lumnitzerae TaxID=2965509 RepID=A0ABQ5MHH1_9FLAO|nr:RIP metalloprotease RseP [Neptunitalea sp. Y10]GLB48485.1 zinc metalloprotease [Neptunitalea sp. Y10]
MNPILVKTLQLLLSLSILIVLHELGHFIPAKLFKTRVEKFFLFFDVKFALFKKKIGDTVYGIGWLPLGGYVKIAGMIDESMDTDQMQGPAQPWEFRSKPAWQRLIIMIGGVTVNLIVGFVIYTMLIYNSGTIEIKPDQMPQGFMVNDIMKPYGFQDGDKILSINGKELENQLDINRYLLVRDVSNVEVQHQSGVTEVLHLPDTIGMHIFRQNVMMPFATYSNTVIDTVVTDMPAYKAGIMKGDKVLSVNGTEVTYFNDISPLIQPNSPTNVIVDRNGAQETIEVTADANGKLGISSNELIDYSHKEYSFGEAISEGASYGYWTLHDYVVQMKFIFTKQGASQVGGFGSIGNMFPPEWDWTAFWEKTALISIILAFMNILPIPALDGGHVLFLLYEMITGRKPSDKFLEYAQMVGFFIVIALVLYANGNDLYRLIFKG